MDKFLSDLGTGYWWISVVVVGVALNLLSSYLKGPIDRLGSAAFERYKARKRVQGVAFDEAAGKLAVDREAREWTVQEETRLYFKCLRRTLLGIWLMLGGAAVIAMSSRGLDAIWLRYAGQAGFYFGLLLWFNAGSVYQQAFGHSALLRRAREIQVTAITVKDVQSPGESSDA
jgi:hypothetical protein